MMITKRNNNNKLLLAVVLLLLQNHSITAIGKFSKNKVQHFIRARCGTNGTAIWKYEGALYDPLDGRTICNVEGIELVRTLPAMKKNSTTNLISKDIINNDSTVLLSRKLFCYKAPTAGDDTITTDNKDGSNNDDFLLSSIKLRPNSPKRIIPIQQSVSLYDTATTITNRGGDKELLLHTEFPNGKCYWGIVESSNSGSNLDDSANDESFDFTVYTKQKASDLPPTKKVVVKRKSAIKDKKDASLVMNKPRTKIIQFGASRDVKSFGVRESYSYNFPKENNNDTNKKGWWKKKKNNKESSSSTTMKYTRYGEGPPWYGPGRHCVLELKGRRVNNLSKTKNSSENKLITAARLIFQEVNKPIQTEDEAEQALTIFRKDVQQQLVNTNDIDSKSFKGRVSKFWNNVSNNGGKKGRKQQPPSSR